MLYIAVDLGTSLIKVAYSIDNQSISIVQIAPEYTKLPALSAPRLPRESFGLPENTAWLRYSEDGECHLIGNLAIDYRGFASKKKLKWQMAVPKILSAIAIVLERESLKFSEVKLAKLGILLPKEEIAARQELAKITFERLKSGFYWRRRAVKITIAKNAISIVPESSGLVLYDRQKYPQIDNQAWVYLMGGKKHWSLDTYINGTFNPMYSDCKDLGLFNLDRLMSQKIPGWNPQHLEMALQVTEPDERRLDPVTYIEKHCDDFPFIDWQKIARWRGASDLELEAQRLAIAYDESIAESWFICRDWIAETALPPDRINALVFAGGTTQLFKPQLSSYFASTPEQLWIHHAIAVVNALQIPESNSSQGRQFFANNYQVRFADVVEYFLILSGYQIPQR